MRGIVLTGSFPVPAVDRREVLRYAGVRGESHEMDALLDECLEEIEGRLSLRVCYTEVCVSVGEAAVDFGFTKVNSRSLCKHLQNCDGAIAFCATVGVELDRLIAKYSRISPAKAVMLNALGAERIEGLCDALEAELKQSQEGEGREMCPRFSPGYGDLSLDFQRSLLTVLNASKNIGVSLNESLSMSPSKSVTAIIGLKQKN